MILDANTTAKMIRYTIDKLKTKNPQYEHEPARSILIAFGELAKSFDMITNKAMAVGDLGSSSEDSQQDAEVGLSHRVTGRDTGGGG